MRGPSTTRSRRRIGMWQQSKHTHGYTLFTGVTVAVMGGFLIICWATLVGCSFHLPSGIDINTPEGLYAVLNSAPYKDLTESQRTTYVEVPGLLKVQHGLGCAQASEAAQKRYIGLR